jgi:cytochrome c biogenesis protein CcdA
MTKEGFFFGIAFAFMLAQCIIGSYGQGLQAIVAGGKLPTPLYYSTAVYDGNDSVYLFGG